jgi:hypothetical protein
MVFLSDGNRDILTIHNLQLYMIFGIIVSFWLKINLKEISYVIRVVND